MRGLTLVLRGDQALRELMTIRILTPRVVIPTLLAATAGCGESVTSGTPASRAEQAAMLPVTVTVQPNEVNIVSGRLPNLAGCQVTLERRWRATVPLSGTSGFAQIPIPAFRDPGDTTVIVPPLAIARVDISCPDGRFYTGKKQAESPTVTPWSWPAE